MTKKVPQNPNSTLLTQSQHTQQALDETPANTTFTGAFEWCARVDSDHRPMA